MKAFGMSLNLKDDPQVIEKYKEYHRHVWPEVEQALKSVGITSMKIFLIGKRLFMYMETVDGFQADRDFPKYLERHPRCREWDQIMCAYQERVSEAKENEWWAMMEQVYELQ